MTEIERLFQSVLRLCRLAFRRLPVAGRCRLQIATLIVTLAGAWVGLSVVMPGSLAAADGLSIEGLPDQPQVIEHMPIHPGTDCDAYASAYADRFLGTGDPNGDIVADAMEGYVEGGAWAGRRGAERGAVAGGAGAVMRNYSNYPGGWEAMYEVGWQICISQQNSGSVGGSMGTGPNRGCRSSATISKNPPGPYTTRSAPGCR
ncbi:MAG: hypothetical protein HWE23_15710 [Rhodobacteraceae bacterium]|nr:hypothetical protein [Paracoccaceae bacterium]